MALTANILAADIHRRMVSDSRFGYSWAERYGATPETWDVDGCSIRINVGDYDCSSSTITAWKLALKAFGCGDVLSGATYTGNMRYVFTRTGLFEWRTDFANAQRGDLYLDEDTHVAMCQGGLRLSEFSSNEFGGAYGGARGDQTGWESHECGYYRGSWDGYLHYIGDLTLGDDDEVTPAEKKEIAKMVVDELMNRDLPVNGEKKKIPFWQLMSWSYFYSRENAHKGK